MNQNPNRNSDLIPKHGGYASLRSFIVAELIYDATVVFCDRYINKRSRTHDQMVQAARSGVQNIVEGSVASGTSKKIEIKLTNVARASLEELLRDYMDYLRQNRLTIWDKDSADGLEARRVCRRMSDRSAPSDLSDPSDPSDPSDSSDSSDPSDRSDLSDLSDFLSDSPEIAANRMMCLIHQATYLLRRQIKRLENDFLENGGFTEKLYNVRRVRQV